jgi:hypothetical protein
MSEAETDARVEEYKAALRKRADDLQKVSARLRKRDEEFGAGRYDACVALVGDIARQCPFMEKDPKGLHNYEQTVGRGNVVWTALILDRLRRGEYNGLQKVKEDIRQLFANFRKYNIDQHTPMAAQVRHAEVDAEAAFVKTLGEPVVQLHNLRVAIAAMEPSAIDEIKRLYCLYNGLDYVRGAKLQIRIEQATHALRCQMLETAKRNERKGAPPQKRPLAGAGDAPGPRRPTASVINAAGAAGAARLPADTAAAGGRPGDVDEPFHVIDQVRMNRPTDTFPSPEQDFTDMMSPT